MKAWGAIFGLAVTISIFVVRIPVIRFGIAKSMPQSDACRIAAVAAQRLAAAVWRRSL